MIDPEIFMEYLREWEAADHKTKGLVTSKWAQVFDVAERTMSRERQKYCKPTRKKRADAGKITPEYLKWARVMAMIQLRGPKDARQTPLDQILDIALLNNLVPPEAGKVPVATYARIVRDMGYKRKDGRARRHQAPRPNVSHQFDASKSSALYVAKKREDGEYILKLWRPSKFYKNKPCPIRLRLWYYGMADDYSGFAYADLTVATGESAGDSINFLFKAWSPKGDDRIPLRGLPTVLRTDCGAMNRDKATKTFLEALGVKSAPGKPYASRARGKIEHSWAIFWRRFESMLFKLDNWQQLEFTVTDIRQRLMNYLVEDFNAARHRLNKRMSKTQAWMTIEKIKDIPENALNTIYKPKIRTLDAAGMFDLDGEPYEVETIYDCKVKLYIGVHDSKIVAEDPATGKKYNVRKVDGYSWGSIKEFPKEEWEKLEEQAKDLKITKLPFEQPSSGNVAYLPPKGKEVDLPPPKLDERPLFMNAQERYDWCFDRKIAGLVIEERDKLFMREFEKTPLYDQLSAGYKRLENFNSKRGALA